MKKFFLSLILIAFVVSSINAQSKVNSYKYIIVPLQYKFLKGQNKYRLNTLTKQLFLNSGYEVYYDNQLLPKDVFEDRCLAMYADVNEVDKGFRITNLEIELRDCKGDLILKSELGRSGINNHEKRYQTSLREAYETINDRLFYQEHSKTYTSETKAEPSKVENATKEATVAVEVAKTNEVLEEVKSASENITESSPKPKVEEQAKTIYYAQKIENGYQIVDSEPKIVMVLLKTGLENVFTVKGKDAIVYKKDGRWVYSQNGDNGEKLELLNIKF